MSTLLRLRTAKNLKDLSVILGYEPKKLSYILYKIPEQEKYNSFEINKKDGGKRLIEAPIPQIKKLQKHLCNILTLCSVELAKDSPNNILSHGFKKGSSIQTNAQKHKNKRFVLNFDIKDFFWSINFGRVRGFFIKNKDFLLDDKVATIIAQIACYNGRLPQGSPTSPIISNLIAHLLDIRLVGVAKKYGCVYSRYADDITFSTNQKEFPLDLVRRSSENPELLLLGTPIEEEVKRSGFCVNPLKTRLKYRDTRQIVTGLVVNKKINVRSEYYRLARAMCHSYYKTGKYLIPSKISPIDIPSTLCDSDVKADLNRLGGILNYIFYTRNYSDQRCLRDKQDNKSGIWKMYRDFIYFKIFGALERPLILCEGPTDSIYLKAAIKSLHNEYPELIEKCSERFIYNISFLKYSKTIRELLHLTGGTGELANFVGYYASMAKQYVIWNPMHPVIIVTDNDGKRKNAATKVFAAVKQNSKNSHPTTEDDSDFFHINNNLYLVKMPHINNKKQTIIEDFFDDKVLNTEMNGRKFSADNDADSKTFYTKAFFAENVVAKNAHGINFNGFKPILNRLVMTIKDYYN
jgi:RNA-directed DNA polymerase